MRNDPTEPLGYLLVDVARHLRRHFDEEVRDLGLTQSQWRVIVHLSRAEGISQAALADRLEIKPISLTRILDRMSAAGWVERRPSPDDRRAVQLFLAPKVQPLLDELSARARRTRQVAFGHLPQSTREQMIAALESIKHTLLSADADGQPAASVHGAVDRARRRA